MKVTVPPDPVSFSEQLASRMKGENEATIQQSAMGVAEGSSGRGPGASGSGHTMRREKVKGGIDRHGDGDGEYIKREKAVRKRHRARSQA